MNVLHRQLQRVIELLGDSTNYFISGSLSFLPLTGWHRDPEHDIDLAIKSSTFEARLRRLYPAETVKRLRLSEVALAESSLITRIVSPRTGFLHLKGAYGLVDTACYTEGIHQLLFSLGMGLALAVPRSVLYRVRVLEWDGIEYRAAPPEVALIPKLSMLGRRRPGRPAAVWFKHEEDARRILGIADLDYLEQLLTMGGVRIRGRKLPGWFRHALDPFDPGRVRAGYERLQMTRQ